MTSVPGLHNDFIGVNLLGGGMLNWPLVGSTNAGAPLTPSDLGLLVPCGGGGSTIYVNAPVAFKAGSQRVYIGVADLTLPPTIINFEAIADPRYPYAGSMIFTINSLGIQFDIHDELGNAYHAGPIAYVPASMGLLAFQWNATSGQMEMATAPFSGGFTVQLTAPNTSNMANALDLQLLANVSTGSASCIVPTVNTGLVTFPSTTKLNTMAYASAQASLEQLLGVLPGPNPATLTAILDSVRRSF